MTTTRNMERRIVSQFVEDVLATGRSITVSLERGYDCEDGEVVGSRDHDAIMAEAFAGDEAHLFVHAPNQPPVVDGQVNSIGWVFIVLGNDGWDVVSDYTTNLETLGLMAGVDRLVDRFEEEAA